MVASENVLGDPRGSATADRRTGPATAPLLALVAPVLAAAWTVVLVGGARADAYVRSRWVLGGDDHDVVGALEVADDHAAVMTRDGRAGPLVDAVAGVPVARALARGCRRSRAVWPTAAVWLGCGVVHGRAWAGSAPLAS